MTRGKLIIVASVGFIALLIAATYLLFGRDGSYDAGFDASVASPAYRRDRPVVLFDEGHANEHLSTAGYRPFVRLLRNDGYDVRVSERALTAKTLAGIAVLIVANARGASATGDASAFSEAEANAVAEWVLLGGSLLLIADHWPFGEAVGPLAERFGVQMRGYRTLDPSHSESTLAEPSIVFARENGLLGDHPILQGRAPIERITRVATFGGQSLRGPADARLLLRLSDTARDLPLRAAPGGAAPLGTAGAAQGLAITFTRGRVVMLGDADLLRAHVDHAGEPIGMNRPGYDNRQFALNVMHWLSRLI